jgi:pentatricopeptide repeat protein
MKNKLYIANKALAEMSHPVVVEVAPYESPAAGKIRRDWSRLINQPSFGLGEEKAAKDLILKGEQHLSPFDFEHYLALTNTTVFSNFQESDYERALKRANEMGEFATMARRKILNNLANGFCEAGKLDNALQAIEEARKEDVSPCVRITSITVKLLLRVWDQQCVEDFWYLVTHTPKLFRWALTNPREPLSLFKDFPSIALFLSGRQVVPR